MDRSRGRPTVVLYLAGLGRSGSTLLERTLARLDDMVAVGEVVHLWDRGVLRDERCGCGQHFHDCDFWTEVGDRAYGGWDRVDIGQLMAARARTERTRHLTCHVTGRSTPAFRIRAAAAAELLGRVYPAISATAGRAVVVDSSKNPGYAHLLRLSPDVSLKVLHTVRDAPAVAHSWSRAVVRPDREGTEMVRWGPTTPRPSGSHRTSGPSRSARRECRCHWCVTRTSRPRRRRSCVVPCPTWRCPHQPRMLRRCRRCAKGFVDLAVDHTVSGNPLRFSTGRLQIVEDDAWREGMSPGRRRLVATLTAPLRRRYGYTQSGRAPVVGSASRVEGDLGH